MRKKLFLLFALLLSFSFEGIAKEKRAQHLVQLLGEMQKREEITPDSFFQDVVLLRLEIATQQDSTQKAIYRATLAHLLALNAHRAQSHQRDTKSHPDSIQEWSHKEYLLHSAHLYCLSLAHKEELHQARSADWLPLVVQGHEDVVFGEDMLSIIWRAARADVQPVSHLVKDFPSESTFIDFYEKEGDREGAMWLQVDSLLHHVAEKENWLRLRDEYADIDACAEIYLRLSYTEDSVKNQLRWLEEGLKRYPHYKRKARLENAVLTLKRPKLRYLIQSIYYPESELVIPFTVGNMKSALVSVYRVPNDFKEDRENILKEVLREGTLQQRWKHEFALHSPEETWKDTLCCSGFGYGKYALVVEGKTSAKLSNPIEPKVEFFSVSALGYITQPLPHDSLRIMAVDAKSGKPQEGVTVSLFQKEKLLSTVRTDKRGHALFHYPKKGETPQVQLERGDDSSLPRKYVNYRYSFEEEKEGNDTQNLFTDRSLYRPGQMVYVSGLSYSQKRWEAQVEEGKEFQIEYYDSNHEKLAAHKVRTDDFGTILDSLQLPSSGLPGTYQIRMGTSTCYIQVEEYLRPTFHVEMDEIPALSLPVDSITLGGRALTFSGIGVAHARVVADSHWQKSFWFINSNKGHIPYLKPDTVWTDAEGRFSLRVPVEMEEDFLRYGATLHTRVDVLSPQGETQQGSCRVPLCSTPLRLWGNVHSDQEKENLSPWKFTLLSSTDIPVVGEVRCKLYQGDKIVFETSQISGQNIVPEGLENVPSGRYRLEASAVVEGDSASYSTPLLLHSQYDTRLPVDTALWCHVSSDKFSMEKPAVVQFGSSLRDAWISCLMVSEAGLSLDTIVHLQDSVVLWKIPYKEEYGQGTNIRFAVYQNGKLHAVQRNLYLEQPDIQLRPHWDTFRDKVQPGQQEEWRLSLVRPDGTPACANVMLTLYDASLDAIHGHPISFQFSREYHIPYLGLFDSFPYSSRYLFSSLNILPKYKKVKDVSWGEWNNECFTSFGFYGMSRSRGVTGGKMLKSAAPRHAKVQLSEVTALPQAANGSPEVLEGAIGGLTSDMLQGHIAGLSLDEEAEMEQVNAVEEAKEEMQDEDTWDALRTDLSELAFFYPQLRTDAQGAVTIAFRLPEGLTSWHLLGFAHTKDMMNVSLEDTIVAQKDLMAQLYLPRFLRAGDEATLTASVRNVSNTEQQGKAVLQILDAETEEVLNTRKCTFQLSAQKDTTYSFSCPADMEHPMLIVRWKAEGSTASDGEQRQLPVLSDMQSVTETKAFSVDGVQNYQLNLDKLFSWNKPSAVNRSVTVEYTSRPIWLALQSLPSLANCRHRDVLSLTSAYYASSLAHYIAHRVPGMQEYAKQCAESANASKLQQAQELSEMVLRETPWLAEARQESRRAAQLSALFEENANEDNRMSVLRSISNLQQDNGSFSWYPGMKGNAYLTCAVAYLLVRLQSLTADAAPDASSSVAQEILRKAFSFLQEETSREVKLLKKEKKPSIGLPTMQYLYVAYRSGLTTDKRAKEDVRYLLSLLEKNADQTDLEERALAAIVLKLAGQEKMAVSLMDRLHTLLRHPDGMYIAYPGGSFSSINRKIQTHVQLMEAVCEVEPQDTALLHGMQVWLLQQKRTQEWEQPSQTADAIYALLQGNKEILEERNSDRLILWDSRRSRQMTSPESPLGYIRQRVEGVGQPRKLTVDKQSSGLSWGAVYAQYQIPISDVEAQQEGLNIRCDIDHKYAKVGDRIHVRYTLTSDRDYEYVQLQAPRVAGAEPTVQLSGYTYQSGLGYYRAIHDDCTEYFFDTLPRGTYVIEEDWLLSHEGIYQVGATKLKCMYAPEYQAHTKSDKIEITHK